MPLSKTVRLLPWTGAVAGLAWTGQMAFFRIDPTDAPGEATSEVIRGHLASNYVAIGCLVLMGICLVFFATAVRSHVRSGEAREATYSNVVYGVMLLMSAGLGQMVMWGWGLVNGAAEAKDDAALHVLSYVNYFSFAGVSLGVATTLLATGLGGLHTAALPRWFSILTLVLGVLSALGAAGIPPGGLVNYVLLPFWLVCTSVIVARRQSAAYSGSERAPAMA